MTDREGARNADSARKVNIYPWQYIRIQIVQPRDIQYEVFGPDLWHADYE